MIDSNDDHESNFDISETLNFSSGLPILDVVDEVDDEHAIRSDHHERIWENIPI